MTTGSPMAPTTKCRSRFVMLAGPGKTGSTSVQSFFKMRADRRYRRISRMANWTFPMDHSGRHCWSLYSRKLGVDLESASEIKEEWRSNEESPPNFFWVCEMAAHLWTRDAQGKALFDVMDKLGVDCPEIIISYRTPRVEHFLSAWKQVTRQRPEKHLVGMSLADFVCREDAKKHFRSMIPYYTNPLGAALEYRQPHLNYRKNSSEYSNWPVTILDLSGIASVRLDVSHVIACEILNFPCQDGWIEGIRRTEYRFNERKRDDIDISSDQYTAIEVLYRQLDCTYRDRLRDDPKVSFLFKERIWIDCPKMTPREFYQLENVDFFLSQIEAIMGCNGKNVTAIISSLINTTSHGDSGVVKSIPSVGEFERIFAKQRDPEDEESSFYVRVACITLVLLALVYSALRKSFKPSTRLVRSTDLTKKHRI